jgi:hypothetical protein
MSAVPNSQTPRRFGKDRVARSMSGDWLGLNAMTRLLKQDVHTADTAMDEMAPSHRVSLGVADLGGWSPMTAKAVTCFGSLEFRNRVDLRQPVRG